MQVDKNIHCAAPNLFEKSSFYNYNHCWIRINIDLQDPCTLLYTFIYILADPVPNQGFFQHRCSALEPDSQVKNPGSKPKVINRNGWNEYPTVPTFLNCPGVDPSGLCELQRQSYSYSIHLYTVVVYWAVIAILTFTIIYYFTKEKASDWDSI